MSVVLDWAYLVQPTYSVYHRPNSLTHWENEWGNYGPIQTTDDYQEAPKLT